jgi:Peptidase family M50
MSSEAPDPTPYLDRQLPLPARPSLSWKSFDAKTLLLLAGSVVIAVLVTPLFGRWLVRHDDWLINPGLGSRLLHLGIVLIAGYLAVIAVHELGHILGGLATGFRFQHVRISVLTFHRTKGLSFQFRLAAAVTGEAKMAPPSGDAPRSAYVVMVFAGPAANLLTAALCALVTGRVIMPFVVMSVVVGISDLFPFESTFAVTDGLRLKMLFFDRPRRERWIAIMRLSAESAEATQPAKMSPGLLASATAVRDNSVDTVTAYALAYAAAMSRREFAPAAHLLESCLQFAACAKPHVRDALVSDAAVYQAAIRHAPAVASAWLEDLPPKARPWLRVRAEAAILEENGEREAAWRRLDEFERTVGGTREQHLIAVTQKWKSALRAVA